MEKIALVLKYLELYAHQAHNLIKGQTFFADHDFLGEIYKIYSDEYDSVIERSIGLGKPVNIKKVNMLAAAELPNDVNVVIPKCFQEIISNEKYLCQLVEQSVKGASQGTVQLLGDIANKSEMRQYKIQQRIKS